MSPLPGHFKIFVSWWRSLDERSRCPGRKHALSSQKTNVEQDSLEPQGTILLETKMHCFYSHALCSCPSQRAQSSSIMVEYFLSSFIRNLRFIITICLLNIHVGVAYEGRTQSNSKIWTVSTGIPSPHRRGSEVDAEALEIKSAYELPWTRRASGICWLGAREIFI